MRNLIPARVHAAEASRVLAQHSKCELHNRVPVLPRLRYPDAARVSGVRLAVAAGGLLAVRVVGVAEQLCVLEGHLDNMGVRQKCGP